MHESSMLRMKWFIDTYLMNNEFAGGGVRVLDVGSCSWDQELSYRKLFPENCYRYEGLDMVAGPNVDIVPQNIYAWHEIPDDTYDVVISGQSFEHNEFFWVTMSEIARILKPGGLTCIIAPRGFKLHRVPVDCWRFDADGMLALAKYTSLTPLHASTDLAPLGAPLAWYLEDCEDSMLVARKPENWCGCVNMDSYSFEEIDPSQFISDMVPFEINVLEQISGKLRNIPGHIYIYGAGELGKTIAHRLVKQHITPKGIIVSDGYKDCDELLICDDIKLDIIEFSEVKHCITKSDLIINTVVLDKDRILRTIDVYYGSDRVLDFITLLKAFRLKHIEVLYNQ